MSRAIWANESLFSELYGLFDWLERETRAHACVEGRMIEPMGGCVEGWMRYMIGWVIH